MATTKINVDVCPAGLNSDEFFERAAIIEYDCLIPALIPRYDYLQPRSNYPQLVAIREQAYKLAESQIKARIKSKQETMNLYVERLIKAGGKNGR